MSSQRYLDFCFGVQALRRRVERDSRDLLGAMGVQALALPHQLASVRRVLTSHAVRHLLADEVGMGKTVQALMVINALRLQRPELRVLIVVPDALMAQWRDEYVARAHEAPVEGMTAFDADLSRFTRLAWPAAHPSPTVVDPSAYDMLVVDEFHSLTRQLQVRILDTAARFQHLLLLSATPPFQDPARANELMQMLEPAWADALAGDAPLLDQVRDREMSVAELLGADDSAAWRDLGGPPPAGDRAAAAQAWCTYRRVIRTRREDWRSHLPRREHQPVVVEPLPAERERQRLMWRYFHHLDDMSRTFDLDLLAQRVVRGAPSLKQRVTYLLGHGHERGGLLDQVDALLKAERGDTRFEALCELLSRLWREDPDAKVLLAAGDNLTVDELVKRVPQALDRIGPPGRRGAVEVVCARNQPKSSMELHDPMQDDEIARAARAFVMGSANLLITADIAKLGLNLQCTRHLILYSVPWDPQEIEQWIGRVDRIGNTAIEDPGTGELRPIVIHTIVQRGLIDERVLRVVEACGVLDHSLSLDSERVNEVRELIRAAALEGRGADWGEVERGAHALGESFDLRELGSPLLSELPWTPAAARGLDEALTSAKPVEPTIGPAMTGAGQAPREAALVHWLKTMEVAGIYELGGSGRLQFSTIRCASIARPHGRPIVNEVGSLDGDLFDKRGTPVHFIAHRRQITQPPRKEVRFDDGGVKRLHFLSHGSPLHEALLELWLKRGSGSTGAVRLRLPPGHPASELRGAKLLIVAAMADATRLLPGPAETLLRVARPDPGAAVWTHIRADRAVQARHDADARLLADALPAQLVVVGARLGEGPPTPLTSAQVRAVLDPGVRGDGDRLPSASDWDAVSPSTEREADRADEVASRWVSTALDAAWTPRLPAARHALDVRAYLSGCEELDRRAAVARTLGELNGELEELRLTDLTAAGARLQEGRLRRSIDDTTAKDQAAALVTHARRAWLSEALGQGMEAAITTRWRLLIRIEQ
jgi:ATP-dependent helicase HepA